MGGILGGRDVVQRHVFDMSEKATHALVARQLRDLADQFLTGEVELSYDEENAPLIITDPVDVTLDMTRNRGHVMLDIRIAWNTA
jgi:amphi-Trp domain-containing protein